MEKQTVQKIKRTVQLRREAKQGKTKFFNKDKLWEVVPIYGDGNCLFCAVESGDEKTLFSCSRKESGYPVNAKHAELERRSAHHLRLKAAEMLRSSTQLVKSHVDDDVGLQYL